MALLICLEHIRVIVFGVEGEFSVDALGADAALGKDVVVAGGGEDAAPESEEL